MERNCLYDIVDAETGEILVEGIRWEIDVHLEIFKRGWTLREIDEVQLPDGTNSVSAWVNVFVSRVCNPAVAVV